MFLNKQRFYLPAMVVSNNNSIIIVIIQNLMLLRGQTSIDATLVAELY